MSKTFYITTPIYYVNGQPHIGHAYTTIAADVFARWNRVIGNEVFFLTGTDEHGQKVLEVANSRGMNAKNHCDDMVDNIWKPTLNKLNLTYDRFFRTTDADHKSVVQGVLNKLLNKTVFDSRTGKDESLLYKSEYNGWYHVKDEIFVPEKDVDNGSYNKDDLIRITETNWWFRMGAFQDQLIKYIKEHSEFIKPESRRNEVIGFLRKPLNDLCISRPKERMPWGIEIPFDSEFVTYVWFDALLNYITATGWHPDSNLCNPGFDSFWPASVQFLGKDILTTHAVYWSTMLMALGLELPQTLFAHGWWVSKDGDKMSKSKGNVIDVNLLVDNFGVDAVRYFLLREIAFGQDGAFSYEGFLTRYNNDLANDLGNLAHRAISMMHKWLGSNPVIPEWNDGLGKYNLLAFEIQQAVNAVSEGYSTFQPHLALEAAMKLARAGNLHIEQSAPWALNKSGDYNALKHSLRATLELCFSAAALLRPVMPDKMNELIIQLGRTPEDADEWVRNEIYDESKALCGLLDGAIIGQPKPLFSRLTEIPESIIRGEK